MITFSMSKPSTPRKRNTPQRWHFASRVPPGSTAGACRLCCAMPEVAEVEFYRRQWDCGLGKKIVAVQLHAQKRIFRGSDPREMARRLTGQRYLRSHARGKWMFFEFSGDNWIGLHLGMSGKMR